MVDKELCMENEIPMNVCLPEELLQLEQIQKIFIDQIHQQSSHESVLTFEQIKDWVKILSALTQNYNKIQLMKKEFAQPREEARTSILLELKESLHQKPRLLKELQNLLSE